MAELHIEDFYKDVALILSQLYAVFPRKATVFVEDISGPDQPDEFGIHSKRHQSCFAAMIWLSEEGFIRYGDTIRQEAIDQAVLASSTFIKLSNLASIEVDSVHKASPMSNMQLIHESLKNASSTQMATLVEHILFG